MDSKNILGELIRQRRSVKRYTQSDLAKQLQYANQNYATSTISAWEIRILDFEHRSMQ